MLDNNDAGGSPSVSLRQRILSPYSLLSFAVAFAVLYFLAVRFDIEWSQTWANIKALDPVQYALAFIFYALTFVFRGARWKILSRTAGLEDIPNSRVPSVARFAQIIVIGWFVNAIALLRLGDAYRAYALSDETRAGFSWSLGTIFAERIIDMVAVFLLIVAGALVFSLTAGFAGTFYIVGAASAMAVALVAILAVMRLGYGARLASILPDRLERSYQRFHAGTVGSFGQLQVPFLLSLVGWILEIARLYSVVQALGFDISIPLVLIAALGNAILSTVPTPGGVGAVEPGLTGLLALEMVRHDAASVTLVDRSITYLSILVVGGLIFLAWNLTRSRRRRKSLDPTSV